MINAYSSNTYLLYYNVDAVLQGATVVMELGFLMFKEIIIIVWSYTYSVREAEGKLVDYVDCVDWL